MEHNDHVDSPREIANERLARGEIDIKEHSKIIELLDSSGEQKRPAVNTTEEFVTTTRAAATSPDSRAVAATLPQQSHAWLWWLFGIIGLFILLVIIGMSESSSSGLTVGQIKHKAYTSGDEISLTLANTSQKSGDVVLFIEYDGIKKCEHIIEMRSGRIDNVKFRCDLPGEAKFHVYAGWSTELPQMAAIAKRINVNWK